MNDGDLESVSHQIDTLSTDLILSLRTAGVNKMLDERQFQKLMANLMELEKLLANQPTVPKYLVGNLMYIFMSLLAEANHAKTPEPITKAAWEFAECVERIFSPPPPKPLHQIPGIPL